MLGFFSCSPKIKIFFVCLFCKAQHYLFKQSPSCKGNIHFTLRSLFTQCNIMVLDRVLKKQTKCIIICHISVWINVLSRALKKNK